MLKPTEPLSEYHIPQSRTTFIFDKPIEVALWVFNQWGCRPFHLDFCVGILSKEGLLIGAFGFSHYNGYDCELHFYGPGVLKKDVVKVMFILALDHLRVNRVTVRTRKEHMKRGIKKLGAEFECIQKCIYGSEDIESNHGHQFVFHYAAMQKLAGRKGH